MKSMLTKSLLIAALTNAATFTAAGSQDESAMVRHYRRGKRLQSPEEKQAALDKAEAKRQRKSAKRYNDWTECLFSNPINHLKPLCHWQTSVATASPA